MLPRDEASYDRGQADQYAEHYARARQKRRCLVPARQDRDRVRRIGGLDLGMPPGIGPTEVAL